MLKSVVAAALAAALVAPIAVAQPKQAKPSPQAQAPQTAEEQAFESLHWYKPGSTGKIADKAEFKVKEGYTFLDTRDTDTFLKLNGNPPPGNAVTIAGAGGGKESTWFGVLSFADEGYVKDDEKIDADDLLKQLKDNNAGGNEERRKQGLPTLTLVGWYFPPRYDAETKRLEWGTRLVGSDDPTPVVNVTTKLLGRSGYTNAVLVSSPQTVDKDLVDFKQALRNFDYVSGEKYSEWKSGDKVAAYGLSALVLGGAAAVATSKGGLKAIFAAIAAGAAALWAGFKRLFGKKA